MKNSEERIKQRNTDAVQQNGYAEPVALLHIWYSDIWVNLATRSYSKRGSAINSVTAAVYSEKLSFCLAVALLLIVTEWRKA